MKIKILRRLTQVATLFLIVLIPVLNIKGTTVLMGTLYSFAVGPVWITDPLSGLQVIIASLSADTVLLISIGIPIVFALIFGRVFCSWMCPQNTISEFVDMFAGRFIRKRSLNASPSPWIRYIILAFLLLLVPVLGFPVANLISAPGIISVQTSGYILHRVVGMELGLIGIIVVAELFFMRRIWCNYVCPQGSLLGLLRIPKTMKVVFAEDEDHKCGRCNECAAVCGLGLKPMEEKIYPLCHNCGDCISACEKMRGEGRPLFFKF